MTHDKLTIVSIYGHTDGSSAVPSIVQSMKELPGSRGLLLSLSRPDGLPDNIEWKPIRPLDYLQYSVFVMHSLYAFIQTYYCLIVQDDSWVLDGKNFKPEYYDYDYIGAATHAAIVGNELQLQGQWVDNPNRLMIQNGGFSLRSKRFLEAPNKLGLTHKQSDNVYLWNEDVQLTGVYRPLLESCGLKFAPEEVSRGFALEYAVPKLYEGFDFSQLLGHHGQSRKLVGPNHVRVAMSEADVSNAVGEVEFLTYLQFIGYPIEYVAGRHTQEAASH
jgi:hypothetical protein